MVPTLEDKTETLALRQVSAEHVAWFDAQLREHHYLGAGRPVGDYLRQIVFVRGQPAALLVWGPACYALKDRDLWIGWSANHRVERLKLIVQNRRFLVLAKKGAEPNLASQTMGVALRNLPAQWYEQFGYRPLLAESFTDPEAYSGTCYKASNWQAVGMSAGYSRHRADFYVANEHPKKLWLLPSAHPPGPRALCRPAHRLVASPSRHPPAALVLLKNLPALDGKTVTADALHCQKPVASTIVAKGGEYLLQIKGNQPGLLKQAQAFDAIEGPLF